MKKVYCVDLDGTLAEEDGPFDIDKIGRPFPGAREFLAELQKRGEVVIFTCRCCGGQHGKFKLARALRTVREWLEENDMPYNHIWTSEDGSKPIAQAYIDNKAVPCDPGKAREAAYKQALLRVDMVLGG